MQSTTIEVLPTSEFRESMKDCLFNHITTIVPTSTGIRFYDNDDTVLESSTDCDESHIGEVLLNARFGGEYTENQISIDIVTLATESTEEKLVRFTSEFVEDDLPTNFPEAFHSAFLYLKDTYQNEEQEMAIGFFASFYAMWIHMDDMSQYDLNVCSLVILDYYEEWLEAR